MSTSQVGGRARVEAGIPQADLTNNVIQRIISPDDGMLSELAVIVQANVTTGGTISVANSVGTVIQGLVVTVPNGATVGTVLKATAVKGDVNRPILRDAQIALLLAGFATAGAVRAYVTVRGNDNPQQPF